MILSREEIDELRKEHSFGSVINRMIETIDVYQSQWRRAQERVTELDVKVEWLKRPVKCPDCGNTRDFIYLTPTEIEKAAGEKS